MDAASSTSPCLVARIALAPQIAEAAPVLSVTSPRAETAPSEPIFRVVRHNFMMRLTSSITTILALVALSIVSALASPAAGSGTATKGQVANPQITIRITLDRTRVVAGTSIKGTAVLTNTTSKAMLVQQCAADGWLAVGLVSKAIGFNPVWSEIACPPSLLLAPGPNRFPVKVITTYGSCLQPGGQSTTFVPKCLSLACS
jgi:hypothetical protein